MIRSARTLSFVSHRLLSSTRRCYSTHVPQPEKKVTLLDLAKKYKEGTPLTMVTAYDYTSAYFVDKAAVDVILVGDSLGMVMLGRDSTTEVTMDEMLHHCKAVSRGTKRAFVVGDMPFGSFEVSTTEAVRNACRLVKEGSVAAVKLEGGKARKNTVKAIVEAGIPVVGHIGLTPQTAGSSGGFRVQGRSAQAAASIFEDALALQDAGCSALVIEFVPELLGQAITKGVSIPTFGIGAGRHTSGQVLVYHDMLGMYPNFTPKFCKQYTNLAEEITKGLGAFKKEVEAHQFPAPAHTFSMKVEEWDKAHDLILASHPNKEGADAEIASALAQVKASLEIESLKAKETSEKTTNNEKATSEKLTNNEKVTSIEKPTIQTQKTETATQKPTPTHFPHPLTYLPQESSFSLPPTDTWTSTNFDVYYNSQFSNNEEGEGEVAKFSFEVSKNGKRKSMKV